MKGQESVQATSSMGKPEDSMEPERKAWMRSICNSSTMTFAEDQEWW